MEKASEAVENDELRQPGRVQRCEWEGIWGEERTLLLSQLLTLTRLKDGWFFLHPARLLVARLGVRVEAVCPEAFSGEPDVSLCPRVHANALARMFLATL